MGIQLDWEVDSDSGRAAIQEDAAAAAARRKRRLTLRRVAAGIAALMALTGGLIFGRLRQVEYQKRAALESVVDGEALAVRLGDERKFMTFQGPADEWRAAQRRRFRLLQITEPRIVPNGEILASEIHQDEARVTVRVLAGDTPDQAVWLYAYTDQGWRHIATESEPSMERTRHTRWFDITYSPQDEALAQSVEDTLDEWWQIALASLDNTVKPPRYSVVIDGSMQYPMVTLSESGEIMIPSTLSEGASDEISEDQIKFELANVTGVVWARIASEQEIPLSAISKVDSVLWFHHQFDPKISSSPLFDAVTTTFGPEFIPEFFRYVREEHFDSITAMRQALRENALSSETGDKLETYLTNYLRAEAIFRQEELGPDVRGIGNDTVRVFFDEQRIGQSGRILQPVFTRPELDPASIRVSETRLSGEILWTRVTIGYRTPVQVGDKVFSQETVYVPFRRVNGRWLHTWAVPSDWGSRREDQGKLVSLHYYELEARHIPKGFIIDQNYQEIATDFGLTEPPSISVPILPDPQNFDGAVRAEPVIQPVLPSIYTMCCVTERTGPEDTLRIEIVRSLIEEVFNYRRGETRSHPAYTAIDTAILQRERQTMRVESPDDGFFLSAPFLEPGLAPRSPAEFWAHPLELDTATHRQMSSLNILAADKLLGVLIARFGPESVGALIANLPTSDELASGQSISYDEWLQTSVGIHPQDIEGDWRDAYNQVLVGMGYPPIP